MALTKYLGMHVYGGDIPGSINDNGSQHTNADRVMLDGVVHQLVTSSRHYVPASSQASATIDVDLNTSGGVMPDGTQFCYRVGLLGLDGFERIGGPEVSLFTPPILLAPDAPGLRDGAGALTPGLYYWALTAKGDSQESILGTAANATVYAGLNQGIYIDAPDDDQGVLLQIWRKKDSDAGWTRITTVIPGDSFLDDGSVPAEKYAMDVSLAPPQTNRGTAQNAITVRLTGDAEQAALEGTISGWRLYRTPISGFYASQSLVHEVIETDDVDGNGEGTLRTSWVDTGDALLTGVPQVKDRSLVLTPYVVQTVAALPADTSVYPAGYPVIADGRLFLLINGTWKATSGGTTVTYGAVLPPTTNRVDGDLHLLVGDGSWAALRSGVWSTIYTPPPATTGQGGSSPILTSPNGSRWRQVVDDDGNVTTVATLEPGPPAAPTNPTLED